MPMRMQPVIAILAYVGLFALAVMVGYVGGQAFLAPSAAPPRVTRPAPAPGQPELPSIQQPSPGPATRPSAPKSQEPAAVPPSIPQETPEPAPAPAPSRGETNVLYRVQVGSFISRENAEARAAKLREEGFDAYVSQASGLFRVQVGAFSVRENAERLAAQLKAAGYDVLVTP